LSAASKNSDLTPVVAGVAVGSNIEPEANIASAMEALDERVEIVALSTFYWTTAIGRPEQPEFLNGAVAVRTDRGPRALKFDVLRSIEESLGRVRTADRFASRTIDLDVVLYGDLHVAEEGLTIPAPDLSRPFVAWPLLEVLGDCRLPEGRGTLSSLVSEADRQAMRPAIEFSQRLKARLVR
jgi:2-amino-4-hydroxy-6-hydroxymethyldihydropteridine diphosphokinase